MVTLFFFIWKLFENVQDRIIFFFLKGVDSIKQAILVPFFNDSIDSIDDISNA